MATAASALSAITKRYPKQLPRFESARSGAIFAALTSDQHLTLYRNRSIPVGTRFQQALAYIEGLSQIVKVYLPAFVRGEVGDSEIVELVAAQLRGTVALCELVDEFVPTISKDDPTYQVRMGGLAKMKAGMGTLVSGSLLTLTERPFYRTPELIRLAKSMKEPLPAIFARLPEGSRTELFSRLEGLAADPKMQDLQPALGELLDAVRKALPAIDSK